MAARVNAAGNYRFAPTPSNSPYSAGVIAEPGYEIVHATFQRALPWREGLAYVDRHLTSLGRPRAALCAIELRCAEPYPRDAWASPTSFNHTYVAFLREWGLAIDGDIPVARTNVAPGINPPNEQVLYAFSYTIPNPDAPPTFVVSGAGEDPKVRSGETSPDAMREKTRDVMATIAERMQILGATWDQVNQLGVYTVAEIHSYMVQTILEPMGPAAEHGLHWFYSRPPIADLDMELDARGIRTNLRL